MSGIATKEPSTNLIRERARKVAAVVFPRWSAYRLAKNTYNNLADITSGHPEWRFINLGYAIVDPAETAPALTAEDEPYRYNIQLYTQAIGDVDFHNKDALEVGSGRGGGSHFIMRVYRPRTMTGLDYSPKNTNRAARDFAHDGLVFRCGNAESMPFAPESFDAVVNIESSHCYPEPQKFYKEVHRVLRPGGHFVYADVFGHRKRLQLDGLLKSAGFEIARAREITANILHAIETDHDRRMRVFHGVTHDARTLRWLKSMAFAVGTEGYASLRDRRIQYWSYILRKR